jgi:hypothetical protein
VGRFPRCSPDPWLRSIDESLPRIRDARRPTVPEVVASVIVIVLIFAMAIWFLFIAHGGIGPGTV